MIYFYNTKKPIIAGTSTRVGGVSLAPFDSLNVSLASSDSYEHVIANRQLLADAIAMPLNQWIIPGLTHSDQFKEVFSEDSGEGTITKSTSSAGIDAIYTQQDNLVLALLHADCVPIMLMEQQLGLIGIVHAGWQGTIKQLTKKLVTHWIDQKQADPTNIHAIIGPAICKDHYFVGFDVYEACLKQSRELLPYFHKTNNQLTFDLVASNTHWLKACGVLDENITQSTLCTYSNPDLFFSYRYQKQTGRQLSFITKKTSD